MTDLMTHTDSPPLSTLAPAPATGGSSDPSGPGGVPPAGPADSSRGRHRRRPSRRIVALTAAVVLSLGGGAAGGLVGTRIWERPAALYAEPVSASSTAATGTLADVVDAVSSSTVTVHASVPGGETEGSGVIVSSEGRVLTNYHVVERARSVTVRLPDGRSATADVVRTDPGSDLALLQVDGASGLTPANLGDSDRLSVGDTVLAFGSPLGLDGTVTAGIVSALGRDANDLGLNDLIQIDAPINAGSSGGPLVDTAGRVVGISVANASTDGDGGNIGIGFAIPINTAVRGILAG
jgi:putative serine protease PepD